MPQKYTCESHTKIKILEERNLRLTELKFKALEESAYW